MASFKIEAIIRETHRMAESPVWEEETGQLVYVDINAQTVCRWDSCTREVQKVGLNDRVGCVALRGKGTYVVAVGTCLGFLDWETQEVQWTAWLDQDKPHNRFNDGKVDPAGRFVAGTMPEESAPGVWEPGQGSLYTLYTDHSVVRYLHGLGIPNGLDWSLDHRTFYHIDSLDRCVRAYDYQMETGEIGWHHVANTLGVTKQAAWMWIWSGSWALILTQLHHKDSISKGPPEFWAKPKLLYQLPKEQGMPDGMCVDNMGKLWVACIDGGQIIRLDPETGTRLLTVKLPVSRVTSCCFGGPNYSDLYVTSASDGLSSQQWFQEHEAGHIFKVTGLGAAGIASQPFLG